MLNLLFSPNGRISSSQMIMGGLILIAIGMIPAVLEYVLGPSSLLSILGLATILLGVPWVFLWMKRYRDGGQSPVMCLVAVLVYAVVFLIIAGIFVGGELFTMFSAGMEAGTDDPEAMEAAMEGSLDIKAVQLKSIMSGAVASLITLFGLNALIKHKPVTSS